jgi:iron complex outermembrane receptor protein
MREPKEMPPTVARGRRVRLGSLVGLALVALLVTPIEVFADVRTEARRHFRRGMELIGAGNLDGGVAELEEAYEILPHPNVLYNIGRAYAEAGRYEDALGYFERYVQTDPPDREEVQGFIAAIEQRVAAAQATGTTAEGTPSEGTAEPSSEAPPATLATNEEIRALEESATQIEALGEATDSDVLRRRAENLRLLARQLQAGLVADQVAASSGSGTQGAASAGQEVIATAEGGDPDAPVLTLGREQQGLYEEQVVSASRFAQTPLDAPNATSIITRQDIRLSGLMNPGDLIRRTPGAHVMATGSADLQIGIRGFNQRLSPRVLMLINGRSVYIDPLGTNFYDLQVYGVEDIERIEVIRGPASALYGADAFSGIINVITREPGSTPGTEAVIGVGNMAQVHGQVSHSGRAAGLGYRLSAGYDQIQRYTQQVTSETIGRSYPFDNGDMGLRIARAAGHLRYRLKPANTYVDIEGGIQQSTQTFQASGPLRDFNAQGPTSHMMGTLQTPWGSIRAFWNRLSATSGAVGANHQRNDFVWHTIDVEATFAREFHFLVDHNLYAGVGYRKKIITWDFIDRHRDENHFNGYFQDTLRVTDHLILVASLRVDSHPLLSKLQVSPRGAIIIRPTEGQALRFSGARAFRTQTFLESYLDLRTQTPIAGVAADGVGSVIQQARRGAAPLRPEEIISAEVGYRYAESDYFDVDVSAYYNHVKDLVILDDLTPYSLADFASGSSTFDDETATFGVGALGYVNDPTVFHVVGGEVAARIYPVTGLDVYANYAYNHAILAGPTDRGTDDIGPKHLVNLGVQYRSPFGLDFSSDLHVVGRQTWQEQDYDPVRGVAFTLEDVPAYYLLNARVGYRLLDDDLELGIAAYNLTNNHHRQHPLGQQLRFRLMGTVAYRF